VVIYSTGVRLPMRPLAHRLHSDCVGRRVDGYEGAWHLRHLQQTSTRRTLRCMHYLASVTARLTHLSIGLQRKADATSQTEMYAPPFGTVIVRPDAQTMNTASMHLYACRPGYLRNGAGVQTALAVERVRLCSDFCLCRERLASASVIGRCTGVQRCQATVLRNTILCPCNALVGSQFSCTID
jgi:hypothetical protein